MTPSLALQIGLPALSTAIFQSSRSMLQWSVRGVLGEETAVWTLVAGILVMALAACAVASLVAFVYRWYSGERAPDGVPILLGLSVIALWLNTTDILQNSLADGGLQADDTAAVTIATFVVGTIAADAGRRVGDHFAADLPSVHSVRTMDTDIGELVRGAGRVVRVTVPENIEDIDGYEPVPADVKTDLAGTTFLFPRRLTVTALRDRFVDRLKHDYDVGHVDVELASDGRIEYLALGRRLAGIGQTIPPGTVAVAVRADPALTATPGDRVQVWRTDGEDEPRRVVSGELRAAVDDVATIVVDEGDAGALSDDVRYRLLTLPDEVQPDREFAALLRTADETMTAIEIQAGSELVGAPLEAIDLTVAAVRSGGEVEAIPPADRTLRAGDTVYAVGRLDAIRRLEPRASGSPERAAAESTPDRPSETQSSANRSPSNAESARED